MAVTKPATSNVSDASPEHWTNSATGVTAVYVVDRTRLLCRDSLAGGLGLAEPDIIDRARPFNPRHRWAAYAVTGKSIGCWTLHTSRKSASERAQFYAKHGYGL